MKTAVLREPGSIEIHDVPDPVPGPGEAVVGVRVALTDGTDLKTYRRGHPKIALPTAFGHEFAGDILAVGRGVERFAPGDRVALVHSAPCGACYWCMHAQEELCATLLDRLLLGGYAQAVRVPAEIVARNMFVLPDDVTYESAAFLEPLACVVHAWRDVPVHAGATVAIYGSGGFAALHGFVARALGVEQLIFFGRRERTRERLRYLGFSDVLDPAVHEPQAAIAARTAGRGADAVIECTGAPEIWEYVPRLVRRGGTVVLFGGLPAGTRVNFDAATLHYDEVRLLSPFHFTPAAVARAFELLAAKRIDPRPLITAEFPLADIAAAFAELDRGDHLKIALRPETAA